MESYGIKKLKLLKIKNKIFQRIYNWKFLIILEICFFKHFKFQEFDTSENFVN
jgi:hypothetical protein